jgi:hypothetical protein
VTVFEFDPAEFSELARAVGARVIVIDSSEDPVAVSTRLLSQLSDALTWWHATRAVSP